MRSYIAARDSLLNSLGIKNHLGVISALFFSLILSACGGGGADNPGPAENGAPLLTEVSISSGDLSAVTVGNTVTVAITANEAILAPSVMIAGVAADGVTGSATSWTASRVMTADDAAGAISLSISFSDISGVNGVTVTQTTDSSSLTMEINSESGHVIDGPFQNALVFADYNGDGVHNEGEPSDTTDADGAYSLLKSTSTPDAYTIVVHMTAETIDSISGESYADTGVVLKAAAGGEVVTPVTTLLEAIKETDPTYTAADLATDLGLPVGVDVTTYNPFADGVAAADAQAVEKVFQSVMSATLIVGEAMSGLSEIADVTVSAEKTRATAMDAIAAMVLASEVPVDLSDSTQLDAVKVEAESKLVEIGVVVDAAIADFVLDKATDTLEQVATAIDNVSLEDFGKPAASAVSRIKHNATAELAAMSAAAITFLADAANTDLTGFDTSATLTLDVPGNVASVVASNMEAVNQHLGIDTDSSAPLVIFANGELINGATLEVDAQDGGDNAAIIALAASATDSNKQVIQISTRDSTMAAAWIATDVDVSSMSEGNLSFDIYMVTAPTAAGDQNFEAKLESGPADAGVPGYATGIGNETALGGDQWHTITLPLSGLLAANQWAPAGPVDAANVSKIVFAAQWTAGQGAVFQIDNVKFTTNSSGSNEAADSGTDSGADTGAGSGLVEGWNLFGGAEIDGSTFTFPAGADSWAGFANKTESLYPFSFPDGGTITFNASIPAGADPVNVKFTFENAPHPDNNPNFSVAEVSVDSASETTYSVSIPAQDANQEYRSFLMYVVDRDAPVTVCNVQISTGDEVVDGIPCAVADDSDSSDTSDTGSNDDSGSTDNSGSADDSSNGGSTDASVLKLTVSVPDGTQSVTITGPWWSWGSSGLVGTDNGDGTWTVEMTPGTENMEYLWVVDGVQENLLSSDFSCTPVTDNSSYANRVWTLGSGDVTSDNYGTCDAPVAADGGGSDNDDGDSGNGGATLQPGVIADFDDSNITAGLAFIQFGDVQDGDNPNPDSTTFVADPADATNTVAKTTKKTTSQGWAGVTVTTADAVGGDASAPVVFPLTTTHSFVSMRVYAPAAGMPIRMKLEDASDASKSVEVEVDTAVGNAWETLYFDFSNQVEGTAALNESTTYSKASIFFNFNAEQSGDLEFYWDSLKWIGEFNIAPTPIIPGSYVTSIFSDSYADEAGTDFTPNWGQSTQISVVDGQLVYANLNYAGIVLASSVDVSSNDYVHVDIYTEDATALELFLINPGNPPVETAYDLSSSLVSNKWVSVDIPLSAFAGVDLATVGQLKVDGNGTVILDNLYFVTTPVPTAAPADPEQDAANVISIFGDTYTNETVNYDGTYSGDAVTTDSAHAIGSGSDVVLRYDGMSYAIMELGVINASDMTHLHLDVWASDFTEFKVKIVDTTSPWPDTTEGAVVLNAASNPALEVAGWVSLDIKLADLLEAEGGLGSKAHIGELVVEAVGASGKTLILDNIYFYKDVSGPSVVSIFSDNYEDIAGTDFNPNWGQATQVNVDTTAGEITYTSLNYQGTEFTNTDVSEYEYVNVEYYSDDATSLEFFLISTGAGEETAYDLAPAMQLGQWNSVQIPLSHFTAVDLTDVFQFKVAGNGTVKFRNWYFSDALSIFSNVGEDLAGTNFNPNWGQATQVNVDTTAGEITYTSLNYQGTEFTNTDVSEYEYVNVEYYSDDATSLEFFLISTGAGEETAYDLAPAMQLGQWNSVQIPLSHFTAVDLTDVFQFKVAGNGTVKFRNWHFGGSAASLLPLP